MPELAKKQDCTGCTACASVCPRKCIKLVENKQGFLYPKINLKNCIDCKLCVQSCPVCSNLEFTNQKTVAFAAYSYDKDLRESSSSGGIFSEIAAEVLKQGGVVFGAAYCDQFEIKHICIESEKELWKLRGAKYAQSVLGDTFICVKKYLKQNRLVLFSGTPCQVAGLKSYLKKDYDLLVCVDFVCHGVPSPAIWKSYIRYRSNTDNAGELPIFIDMRSKETGWSRYRYSNIFQYKEKSWRSLSGDSLYMKLFVGDYINRTSCGNCHIKGYNRMSDITLGDFWGIWEIDPGMDDDKGTSLILLHSNKAHQLFCVISNHICYKSVPLEETSRMNQSLLYASAANKKRDEYIEKAIQGAFDILEKELISKNQNLMDIFWGIKAKVRRMLRK